MVKKILCFATDDEKNWAHRDTEYANQDQQTQRLCTYSL
uniref:Uncharacterized protein n=1 Tax=Comamonas testosteroni TaxID=285 RepID=D3VWZ9_COMTE|nr:unknown [Comamonas testosteroni]